MRHLLRSTPFQLALWLALLLLPATAAAAGPSFTPASRVSFTAGDQWEPTIAADGFGHLYVLHPQYRLVPGCSDCPLPSMTLLISNDNGATWQPPRAIAPPDSGQFDPQIVVDPLDRRTVYAAWVENDKTDLIVAKSTDFGQSWSMTLAVRDDDIDKPTLVVRGEDISIAYNFHQTLWVASSHDGGLTFTSAAVTNLGFKWTLPGGGTTDPAGTVYFSWSGYTRSGKINLYISKSSDGGKTWLTSWLANSSAAPTCASFHCGWSYLGAQIALASDSAGTLYVLWNAGAVDHGPGRVYFASSTTAGITWSPKVDVSTAAPGVEHAFPAIAAGAAGDVRISWMDTRRNPLWNVYYRSSTNGGATWSAETRLSSGETGYAYVRPTGFVFPFGDYFGLTIDNRNQTHAVWGEGMNFKSPGSIWYATGR